MDDDRNVIFQVVDEDGAYSISLSKRLINALKTLFHLDKNNVEKFKKTDDKAED